MLPLYSFTIYWESYLKSDRLKIHDKVLCSGYTKIDARNEKDAYRIWSMMFPMDTIINIK